MCIFAVLWTITLWRARRVPSYRVLKTVLVAATFSAGCIIVRNFYRAFELAQGWTGYLITHETYFCFLDGALVALAVGAFNVVHPTWFESLVKKGRTPRRWVSSLVLSPRKILWTCPREGYS